MKHRSRWMIATGAAVSITAVVLLVWLNPFRAPAPTPTTVKVVRGDLIESASLTGRVEAKTQVDVKSRASGEVIEIAVQVGDTVKAGDLLVKLDPEDETRAVEQAQAQFSSSEARLARAQASHAVAKLQAAEARAKYEARSREPVSDAVTREEVRIARSNAEIAEATVASLAADVQASEADLRSAKLNVDQARLRLSETTIVAPIAGTVLSIEVEIGTIISSGISNIGGGTSLLTLGDLSSLYVVGMLDEADVGRVDQQQEVKIRVDAYPGRVFSGVVERLSPLGRETSNIVTFDLDMRITDKQFYLLRPGMSADLEIVTSHSKGVLLVPVAAIFGEGSSHHVRSPDGARHEVTLGPTDGTNYAVLQGVEEGQELLVSNSTSGLSPGPGLFGRR